MNSDLIPVALSAGWITTSVFQGWRLRSARRDPLTGVWTRAGFERRASRVLRHRRCLVALVDVDDFKQVNDRYGHAAGDTALVEIAVRLTAWAGRSGVVGRLGGDEFAAVRLWGGVPAELLAADLRHHLDLPGEVTASVGAVPTGPGTLLTDALSGADAAMYHAKHGRLGWSVGDLSLITAVTNRRHRAAQNSEARS